MTLTIIVPTIVFGLFLVFAIYKVTEIRKKKPVIGTIIGDTAQTIDPLGPGKSGFVRYNGEYWQARSEEEIGIKEKVEIIGKEKEVLLVKRKSEYFFYFSQILNSLLLDKTLGTYRAVGKTCVNIFFFFAAKKRV
jgi:membrane-bound ClpP family serine protease